MKLREFIGNLTRLDFNSKMLFKKKSKDYSPTHNVFQNFEDSSVEVNIEVEKLFCYEIVKKINRLTNLLNTNEAINYESLQDNAMDIVVYSKMLYIYLEGKDFTKKSFIRENYKDNEEGLLLRLKDFTDLTVCKHFKVTFEEYTSTNRYNHLTEARQFSRVLFLEVSKCTLKTVATLYKVDHTTILNSKEVLHSYCKLYPAQAELYAKFKKQIALKWRDIQEGMEA
jgi:chromosomal replication initiation ATPase DnaA